MSGRDSSAAGSVAPEGERREQSHKVHLLRNPLGGVTSQIGSSASVTFQSFGHL